jgi:hypothetical protein
MKLEFVTVDVFTDRPFGGNPLAVMLDARGLTSAQMQAIAAEFNLPKRRSYCRHKMLHTPRKFVFLRRAPNCRLPAIRTSAPLSCSPAPRQARRGPPEPIR